ncbi:uncharacterized protein B0T15DRAFT_261738 [Chaetomium strumarium]|uniref:Zn(2)-C6 fungal-type domain-containing protein n=1 Tax=Chaetomium strumarium TaxID=1170767 RepID=A0AAJ0LZ38_9PEZI|nr:hypothetical protein B0T15DRAFT_261738 [Chaetomium strumarium]
MPQRISMSDRAEATAPATSVLPIDTTEPPPPSPASVASSPASGLPTPSTDSIQRAPWPAGGGRRTHKKSRTGCSTCKARKIKCDERRPACLNCISHGVECPFLRGRSAAATNPRTSSTANSHSSASPANPPSPYAGAVSEAEGGGEQLPLLELELLHNFTTKTYSTLTADASLWEFWRDDVVQLGLTCDYIMRAVLAVSALHLAYHRPDRRNFYTESGILLHQKAARSAMRVMAAEHEIDKDTAASLFIFSMLTIFFALASPRRSNPDGTFFIGSSSSSSLSSSSNSELGRFPDWAFLVSGGKSIMDVLGERGLDTVAAPFLHYGRARWHAHRAKLHEHSSNEPLLAPLRARIFATTTTGGGRRAAGADEESTELLHTYAHALDELELALVVSRDPATPRDVLDAMVWLWEVSDSLVPLLRGTEPRQEAVAIFAHFCVLLKQHEAHWWLQGWGEHVMVRALEVLDEEHKGWIEWPMREMGWMGGGGGEGAGSGGEVNYYASSR